jgi:hypothetical protein
MGEDSPLDLDKLVEAVGVAVMAAAQAGPGLYSLPTVAAAFRDFAVGYAALIGTPPEAANAGG